MDVSSLTALVQAILAFAGLGPAGWIASGVLGVMAFIGAFIFKGWMDKQKALAAAKQSEDEKNSLESGITHDNSAINNDLKNSEDELRNIN